MTKTTLAAMAISAAASACAAPPVAAEAPAPPPSDEPVFHVALSETAGANLTQCALDAQGARVETWPRGDAGSVLFASAVLPGERCHPSVMIFFAQPAAGGQRLALGPAGSPAGLHFEEQCSDDGSMRSWAASDGVLAVDAEPAGGFRLRVERATMRPSENGDAVGWFRAEALAMHIPGG
jgi:hypothetical protein